MKTKDLTRCNWALSNEQQIAYHDNEWGVPVRDDRVLFEFLTLEGAQAGLSWDTVLRKRATYREAFCDFDPVRVARLTKRDVERLMGNPGIVRNRLKIESTISNARAFLELQSRRGSFTSYLWDFVDGRPLQNKWAAQRMVPASTPLSDHISKSLKKEGFRFVGSTIIYAYMQAVGLVNDHLKGCFRHREVQRLQ